jgi:hypothetical protein
LYSGKHEHAFKHFSRKFGQLYYGGISKLNNGKFGNASYNFNGYLHFRQRPTSGKSNNNITRMIQLILELLKSDNFFGVSEIVDVAKGKHELTDDIKKVYNQKKRKQWQKNGQ